MSRKTPLRFLDTTGSPNLGQVIRPYNKQQNKRTCRIVDFAVQDEHSKIERKGKER